MRVERVTCDLKDYNMGLMPSLQERKVLVVGKHLCGGATDLALHLSTRDDTARRLTLTGVGIATCWCVGVHRVPSQHFPCRTMPFVNPPFGRERTKWVK